MNKLYLLVFLLTSAFTQQIWAQGTETFDNMPANASSYATRTWTGNGSIEWTATDARTDQTLAGRAIAVRNGSLTANTIPNGIGNLSFKHLQVFSGSGSVLEVYVNNNLVGTANPTTTAATASFNNINVPGTFKLEIKQVTSGLRIIIDDVTWTAASVTPCVTPAAQPTGILFSGVTTSAASVSFTAAAPVSDKYLVTYGTAATPDVAPADGATYSAGQLLGNTTVAGYGTALSWPLSSLSSATQYYVHVYAANDQCSGGPKYPAASPLSGSFTTATVPVCQTPGAPTNLLVNPFGTSAAISFTAPALVADAYLVVFGTAALSGWSPENGISYNLNQTVGNGTVGYKGANPSAFISGLTASTHYFLDIYAYNAPNCTGGPLYSTTSLTGDFTTLSGEANIPAGYYDTIAGKTCDQLKSALAWRLNFDLAKNPLTPRTYTELWTQYLKSDVKPREVGSGSPMVIWDMYSDNPTGPDPYNFTPGAISEGGQQDNGTNVSGEGFLYNREHSTPLNWFNSSGNTNPGPATDYLHIFPTDKWVNALRDSYIYGEVTNPVTTTLNGSKLGPNAFAGLSGTAFEPIDAYKGDFARAFLYFVTRYQANMPGWNGGVNGVDAFDPTLYPSVDIPYLRLMLKWHAQDPVSDKERSRNDSAYVFQGNRNPYIDLPAIANLVWSDACGIILPIKKMYLKGTHRGNLVQLDWKMAGSTMPQYFEVERSLDGRTFKTIGSVPGRQQTVVYQYEDNIEKLGARRLYYRVKMMYAGSNTEYSDVYTIHIGTNTRFTVFANPAANTLTVDLGSGTFSGELSLTNISGQKLVAHKLTMAQGKINIATPVLKSGKYIVTLVSADGQEKPQNQSFSILR